MQRKQTKKQDLAAAMPPGQKKIKNELQAASNKQQAASNKHHEKNTIKRYK